MHSLKPDPNAYTLFRLTFLASPMKFKHVVIQSLAAVEPPIRVTSKEIEEKLKPTLDRLGIRDDLLEEVSGIGARRFWEKGTAPSDAATLADQSSA